MGNRIPYITLTLSVLLLACRKEVKDDCFTRPGETAITERRVDSFSALMVGEKFDVILVDDSAKAGTVVLEAPANMLDGISVEVKNGELTIRNANKCQWLRNFDQRIKARVYVHQLCSLRTSGACTVTSENQLRGENLFIEQESVGDMSLDVNYFFLVADHREAGRLTLKGYIAVFVPNMYNTGILDAREATGDYIFVYHFGLNEIHVKPYKALINYVRNKGNIYYYQDPVENLESYYTGEGKVMRAY